MTVSSLATAGGTLVLAVATFGSVRSANRSTRLAERSLLAGLRPLIVNSRTDDPAQKVGFADRHWVQVPGGGGTAEVTDDAIYLTMSVRNAGAGVAVLDSWWPEVRDPIGITDYPSLHAFQRLTRDLYLPPNDFGFWQGALRDPDTEQFREIAKAVSDRQQFGIYLVYGDFEGGQHTVTRFSMIPAHDDRWLVTAARHWIIDGHQPR